MQAKPFTLQAPEDIAMKYGGNKQKIAQAAQTGMVDPTAAIMAGMFIDRMRSAQFSERKPQATVAQEVMAPPAPAAPPPGGPPQAGLGALPPGGPPPEGMPPGGPPPMGGPPPGGPPPGMPGMAGGGLLAIGGGVPDDMYDGYATGGLVSFAGDKHSEVIDPDDTYWKRFVANPFMANMAQQGEAQVESGRAQAYPGAVAGRMLGNLGRRAFTGGEIDDRTGEEIVNSMAATPPKKTVQAAEVEGRGGRAKTPTVVPPATSATAAPPVKAPPAAPPVKAPVGAAPKDITKASAPAPKPRTNAGAVVADVTKAAVTNTTSSKTVEKYVAKGVPEGIASVIPATKGGSQLADMYSQDNITKGMDFARGIINADTTEEDAARKELKAEGTPEAKKKRGKKALWEAVTMAGLGMMGGESQYALTNIAKGAQEGMKRYGESRKEIKEEDKDRRKELSGLEAAANARRIAELNVAISVLDKQASLADKAEDRASAEGIAALREAGDMKRAELQAQVQREATAQSGRNAAMAARGGDRPDKFDKQVKRYADALQQAHPGMNRITAEDQAQNYLIKQENMNSGAAPPRQISDMWNNPTSTGGNPNLDGVTLTPFGR